jgi:HSP20 family protein
MRFRETLPWNWHKKEASTEPESLETRLPRAPGFFNLFNDFHTRPFAMPVFPALQSLEFEEGAGFLPALDAKESDTEVRITVELPGLDEKDVEVSLKDDILTIRGEKQDEQKHEKDGAQWVERRFGSFRREIPLPADMEPDGVRAHFKAGVLTITVPRTGTPEEPHRAIPIQAE